MNLAAVHGTVVGWHHISRNKEEIFVPKKVLSTVTVRVVTAKAPGVFDGQRTEFGIQNRDKALFEGNEASIGRLHFEIELSVALNEKTGRPRFRGPLVHNGSSGQQHLYIGWRFVSPPDNEYYWINRLKVHLLMSWKQVEEAIAKDLILTTDATEPEWGVLKNWHGLKMGHIWCLESINGV